MLIAYIIPKSSSLAEYIRGAAIGAECGDCARVAGATRQASKSSQQVAKLGVWLGYILYDLAMMTIKSAVQRVMEPRVDEQTRIF